MSSSWMTSWQILKCLKQIKAAAQNYKLSSDSVAALPISYTSWELYLEVIVLIVELQQLLTGEKIFPTNHTGPFDLAAFILTAVILRFVKINNMQNPSDKCCTAHNLRADCQLGWKCSQKWPDPFGNIKKRFLRAPPRILLLKYFPWRSKPPLVGSKQLQLLESSSLLQWSPLPRSSDLHQLIEVFAEFESPQR